MRRSRDYLLVATTEPTTTLADTRPSRDANVEVEPTVVETTVDESSVLKSSGDSPITVDAPSSHNAPAAATSGLSNRVGGDGSNEWAELDLVPDLAGNPHSSPTVPIPEGASEDNWRQGPATKRGGVSQELTEVSANELETLYPTTDINAAKNSSSPAADDSNAPPNPRAAKHAVNDPGGTQPTQLGIVDQRPTLQSVVTENQEALETRLDDVLAEGDPPARPTLAQFGSGTKSSDSPVSTPHGSLEATLERALRLGDTPVEFDRYTQPETDVAAQQDPIETPLIESTAASLRDAVPPPPPSDPTFRAESTTTQNGTPTTAEGSEPGTTASRTVLSKPMSAEREPAQNSSVDAASEPDSGSQSVRTPAPPAAGKHAPVVVTPQDALLAAPTSTPLAKRGSTWKTKGLLLGVGVLAVGALLWMNQNPAVDHPTSDSDNKNATGGGLDKVSNDAHRASVVEKSLVGTATEPGSRQPHPQGSVSPVQVSPKQDAIPSKTEPVNSPSSAAQTTPNQPPAPTHNDSKATEAHAAKDAPVAALMTSNELSASDLARLPDDLKPEAVIYLMQRLSRRLNDCHRGGRINGHVDIVFQFQVGGTVANAQLIGEPVASAPVATCLIRQAKGFKLPTKNGQGLNLRRTLRLR